MERSDKMVGGWREYQKIQDLIEIAEGLEFEIGAPEHEINPNLFGVWLKGESYPIYNRESCMFTGTYVEVRSWLSGVRFMRDYYNMINVTTDKAIAKAEDIVRQKITMEILKTAEDRTEDEIRTMLQSENSTPY